MYISISKSASPNLWDHKQFKAIEVKGWHDVARVMVAHRWSPIVWTGGKRLVKNFESSRFCALDIDDGISLADVIKEVNKLGLGHAIATTRSHQKDKGGKVADRFRLVLMWEREINCSNLFKHNNRLLADRFGADTNALDGARMFAPSVEVVSVAKGACVEVVRMPPKREGLRRYKEGRYSLDGKKPLTAEVKSFIEHGTLIGGGRNCTIFRVAGYLSWAGYKRTEIESIIENAPIDRSGLGRREVEQAILNATKERT